MSAKPDPKRAMASMDDRQQGRETGGGAGTKVRAEVTWGLFARRGPEELKRTLGESTLKS